MSAGAQRDKLLADLFSSRGGLSMMPIMAQDKSGIERLEEEAKASGLTLTDPQVAQLHGLSEAPKSMKDATEGASVQLGLVFVPVVASVTAVALHFSEAIAQQVVPRSAVHSGRCPCHLCR